MMYRRYPRKILITGGSSGLGAALAEFYAASGATLFISGRDAQRLEETRRVCERNGGQCFPRVIDVTDKEAMNGWITGILNDHGTLDLVIANAGVSGGTAMRVGQGANPVWDGNNDHHIFETNLMGVLHTINPVLPHMMASHSGQIALISSMASFVPLAGAPSYSASKAAVRFYGEALHAKLKPYGVTVTVVCPGFITTRMTDHNQFPMPFLMSAQHAATLIAHKLTRKPCLISFPWPMRLMMGFMSLCPSFFTREIFSRLPEKHN